MKKLKILALVFILSGLFCLANANAVYAAGTMTDLGTLGGLNSYAYGINDSGQVVGASETGPVYTHAFLYSAETMTDLGTLGGTGSSYAYGVNASGEIVGQALTASALAHAFLYAGGNMTDLGTLGGFLSVAYGINASAQIVGSAETTPPGSQHAFSYSGETMTNLGTLGGPDSYARGINDSGQIVGYSTTTGGMTHAFLYSGGQMTDLGSLAEGISAAYAINNNGQIVGYSYSNSGYYHAFIYNPEPQAVLSVNPTNLSPRCVRGQNAASQSFAVQNTGVGSMNYTITKDAVWLSVIHTSGTSSGEPDTIAVNYATSGLASGNYHATITVSAPGATGTPKIIEVNLAVKPPAIAPTLLLLN